MAAQLPQTAWQRGTRASRSQPAPAYHYAALRLRQYHAEALDPECCLVLRRNTDGADLIALLSNAPVALAPELLGQLSALHTARRHALTGHQNAIGLAEYQTRSWRGWHHPMTLCLLAGAFVMQLQHLEEGLLLIGLVASSLEG